MSQLLLLLSQLQAHAGLIFGVLFAISEVLSYIPQVEANGVFQAIQNFLKKEKDASPVNPA